MTGKDILHILLQQWSTRRTNQAQPLNNPTYTYLSIHEHSAIRLRGLRQSIRPAKYGCITQEI